MARPKADIKWELLEADWAAGIKSPRQMAAEYQVATGQKVSHEGIRKHFDEVGLKRDLQGKIKQRAQELVDRQLTEGVLKLPAATEKQIVEVAARNQADIILNHRSDIQRYKSIASALLAELEATTANKELFDNLGFLLRSEDEKGVDKLNDVYQKVMSLPGRSSVMKQLAETLKILIGLERQAFGLSDNANGDSDAPKDPAALTPNDAARRIAFTLLQAAKGK